MYIEQIYTKCLAQTSYYIESEGLAAIVDPIRDVDNYIDIISKRNSSLKYIFITHFHADFVSGHIELAQKTGALIVFGPLATPNYNALIASDGELFSLGECGVQVLHTPGHTIESSCFLLYNENKVASALFSGDTLFVGDVGRPDLLSGNLDAKELASQLYNSIHAKIIPLNDNIIVYPGHGAGSACGKNLGTEMFSSIGVQKKINQMLQLSKEQFIENVTCNQPLAPSYFFKDALINKQGYGLLNDVLKKSNRALSVSEVASEISDGAILIDTRTADEFEKGHIPNSINIGLEGQFAIWAGTLISFNHPLIIIAPEGEEYTAIVRLARIGYENVKGFLNGGINKWNKELNTITCIEPNQLKAFIYNNKYTFIDVRKKTEIIAEPYPNAINIPLDELPNRIKELNKNNYYAIFCAAGYRSMIAVSLLKKEGFQNIVNIRNGIKGLKTALPELEGAI
jgi:hydroxyacylglutathione hydrolase